MQTSARITQFFLFTAPLTGYLLLYNKGRQTEGKIRNDKSKTYVLLFHDVLSSTEVSVVRNGCMVVNNETRRN